MQRLTEAEITEALAALPGWERLGDTIERTYALSTFPTLIAAVVRIADAAEAADHHPDLDLRYRNLRVVLSTHDVGGLSPLDVELASVIDAIVGSMP